MSQHPAPNIKGFVLVIWNDWLALMSAGVFTVALTIGTILFSGFARDILGATAILAFLVTAYRIWSDERMRLVELEQHLAPRLRIEFDPTQPKYVSLVPSGDGRDVLFIRVGTRAVSPTVNNCRAYLLKISQWNGLEYLTIWDESLSIPWSYTMPNVVTPRQLNHDVGEFLDVAWLTDPTIPGQHFGFLHPATMIPNRLRNILATQVLPFPERNLKVDVVLVGDDSENAMLSPNIHRGQPKWDQPQVGWMDRTGNAIHHREGNV